MEIALALDPEKVEVFIHCEETDDIYDRAEMMQLVYP
jgi:hypothetical protein